MVYDELNSMLARGRVAAVLAAILLGLLPRSVRAQQSCVPPELPVLQGENLFPAQKEVDLGDVLAEHLQHNWRVIDDDAVNAYLNQMAGLLLAGMPGPHVPMRVRLIDQPVVNAFGIPGGRIYVTRKVIAFARNDAEVAGLLSHEMGHILAHQGAVETSSLFRRVLGVTAVSDRADIFAKYNQLIESERRDPKALRERASREEPDQYQADQIALIAMANAGYAPQAFVDFFDRLARTQGKTGNWFSDLFGATTPNQKRLREMEHALASLPKGCRAPAVPPASAEFLAWQAAVVAYTGLGRKDSLYALLERKVLNPPLRTELTRLRFSPDGKFILAQDESGIYVVTREPFRVLFRIDAPEAGDALFSPDSAEVLFATRGHHVERWSLAQQQRTAASEITVPEGCMEAKLSPDGTIYACYTFGRQLLLLDVKTGAAVFSKEHQFESGTYSDLFDLLLSQFADDPNLKFHWVHLGFSTDGRYFLASHDQEAVAYDLANHAGVPLHGDLRGALDGGFTFLDAGRILGVARFKGHDSVVATFPDCKTIEKLRLGKQEVEPASHGDYVLLRPIKDAPLGVMDLKTKKVFYGNLKSPAGDVYDNVFLAERVGGEVGLFDPEGNKKDEVTLPIGPLPAPSASAISEDLRWIAFSGKRRGAVWDLTTNKRLYYVRNFNGAYFDGAGSFYADFPKLEETERSVARASLEAVEIEKAFDVPKDAAAKVFGRFLLLRKPLGKTYDKNINLEVRDVRNNSLLWSRHIAHEAPDITLSSALDSLVARWPLSADEAKEELKNDGPLSVRAARITEPKKSTLLVAFRASTGKVIGRLALDTGKGSFGVESAYAAGDLLVMHDSTNRTLVYALPTGQPLMKVFGGKPAFSIAAGLLVVENDPGVVEVYDLKSFQKRGELTFGYPVSLFHFSADGKRLLVLTKNQSVYIFDADAMTRQPAKDAATRSAPR